ncbi:MAG TPA: DUF697 domain-containing protein [Pseudomonas xinjiangensis]|uniref:DUF697 domain-containing protein n=2 Tax=root TaxID=1 RepID=A0A7V1BPP8_9GAMM|nr:DUF697 domain-containing protein [Halopseudomonas xinjiangensis]HEC49367.1 DUF697 domain-containing protein [Halopseudomonas xinjiangensis]
MNEKEKTRILDSWEEEALEPPFASTRILGEATLTVRGQKIVDELPLPGALNAPPLSPWPRRLWGAALAVVVGGVAFEWAGWTWAAWQWNPVAGGLVGAAGAAIVGTGLFAWRDIRRQRGRLTALEQLRLEMKAALADPRQRLAVDWIDRLQALYADTPLANRMRAACADLDGSHSAEEVSRRLNLLFYQPLDLQARQMIRRGAIGTGMLVATSPWVTVDLLLVVWRNIRVMQQVAVCFGLPVGQLGRWRLARHVLRNIALAGGTEMAIGALSDSLLSGLMEKLAARIGQGIGIGLYSARLGHFTLDLCRAVPLGDKDMLLEDNRGIINGIRERMGRDKSDPGV